MHFSFNEPLPVVYIVIFFVVSVLIAFFYYRNTKVEGSKYALIALRTFFIFFLLLLFISPLVSYLKKEPVEVLPVILTDNSKSELIESRYSLLNKDVSFLNRSYPVEKLKHLNFDGNVSDTSLSAFNRNVSEINNAFESLLKEKDAVPGTVTIVSDGMFNHGKNALLTALKLQCPVNFILTGDTVQKKDVLISDIYFNRTSFVDSRTQVKIQLKSFGYSGNAEISLYLENNIIEKKSILLDPSKENYEAEFFITSSREGFIKYRAEVSLQPGEITVLNNSKEFVIGFLDNKFDVLFISGGPSSDLVFVKDEISRISNIRPQFFTQKSPGELYEGENINFEKKDAIILLGYPTAISDINLINSIRNILSEGMTSLIFMESRNIDYEKLKILSAFLPVDLSSSSNTEEETGLSGIGKVTEGFTADISQISGFNPVFRNRAYSNARSNSFTYITSKSGSPALVINNSSTSGNAAFLFHGLYKWKLNPSGNYRQNFFGELLLNTLKNIVKKDKQKGLEISVDEDRLNYNELKFIAKLDLKKINVNDPKVRAVIRIGNEVPENIVMNKKASDRFEYTRKFPEGINDFRIYAELEGGTARDNDSLRVVYDNNFEYRETKVDRSQLKELAINTGGSDLTGYIGEERLKVINDQQKKYSEANRDKEVEYYKRNELKFNGYYLILMMLFLFSEWIIRKRKNLV